MEFSEFPNKQPKADGCEQEDVWPEYGENCEMNLFYREYDSAEGWLNGTYLAIWDRQEVAEFAPFTRETFPEKYRFFASDGGGTQFAFYFDGSVFRYISAPDIGTEEDIRELGSWSDFMLRLRDGDYI